MFYKKGCFHRICKVGKPVIKKKTIAKLIQITENLDLCDIWRVRNPKRK